MCPKVSYMWRYLVKLVSKSSNAQTGTTGYIPAGLRLEMRP